MSTASVCLQHLFAENHTLEEYQGGMPRWCKGCGDNAILAAVQRLCRDEGLRPEKTVFVSGIGCSSRLPHYMRTYGFHGIHGRALPIAEGIKLARPDLHVFVNTGDGDCCSIGAAHWIHAIRYNMNITVLLHDRHRGVPSPRLLLRARPAALPGVRRQHVRALGARSAAHADAHPRERHPGEPGAAEDLPQPDRARSRGHQPGP
jgi:hypothetical protein